MRPARHPTIAVRCNWPESSTLEAAFKDKMPKNPERYEITMDDIVEMFRHINNIAPAPGRLCFSTRLFN